MLCFCFGNISGNIFFYKLLTKIGQIIRWFKFTLKPPYSIACCKLQLAIWSLETYPRTYSGHFSNMSLLVIPGLFEYFSENGWSQKIKSFLDEGAVITPLSV